MLELSAVSAAYGAVRALENVSLRVGPSQLVCLLGANGAGKTTTLNSISAIVRPVAGSIVFDGTELTALAPEEVVECGVVQVPEGREIFPELSVAENLELGAWLRRRDPSVKSDVDMVYDYFPRLKERRAQHAGTLSGGEQQMLTIGRALMARPKMLLLDEPSLGLSPVLVENLFAIIVQIHRNGVPILLVEQNARLALSVSDYGYILENGEIRLEGTPAELENNPEVQSAYLGG